MLTILATPIINCGSPSVGLIFEKTRGNTFPLLTHLPRLATEYSWCFSSCKHPREVLCRLPSKKSGVEVWKWPTAKCRNIVKRGSGGETGHHHDQACCIFRSNSEMGLGSDKTIGFCTSIQSVEKTWRVWSQESWQQWPPDLTTSKQIRGAHGFQELLLQCCPCQLQEDFSKQK